MSPAAAPAGASDRFGARLILVWAGLSVGVAFLATPAKFLAPSLSLAAGLDVGRHTFRIYNRAEIVLLLVLALVAAFSQVRRRWAVALAIPAVILAAQAIWLLPALDARVTAIMAGAARLPRSNLHAVYVVAEAVKLAWLLGVGFSGWLDPAAALRSAPGDRSRRPAEERPCSTS